jgi:phosphoribosyl 1,2-cyclic phosphodiesterase
LKSYYSAQKVDEGINMIRHTLSEGQALFHGGLWPDNKDEIILTKPFSTSLCTSSAEWKGKAYGAHRLMFSHFAKKVQKWAMKKRFYLHQEQSWYSVIVT